MDLGDSRSEDFVALERAIEWTLTKGLGLYVSSFARGFAYI